MTYPSDPAASPTPAMPTADSLHCAPAHTHTPLSGFLQRSRFSSALPQLSWLWHGYLAAGNITLLTSQWKSGKTTLLSVLLAKMAQGGVMAGLRVKPAKAVVLSEESHVNWGQRNERLHFGDNVGWLCRPFRGKPTHEDWTGLVDSLVALQETEGLDFFVIDPLVNFLPGHGENSADTLVANLLELQRLTKLGVSVLILHHPRKGETRSGQAARGSGVLGGFVDILLEMKWYARPTDPDRRRVIEAFSRHDATPKRLVLELTTDMTDYISHGDLPADDFAGTWEIMSRIFAEAKVPLTRAEIRRRWPSDFKKPDNATLWRWLERLVGEQMVVCEGRGRRNDPFRYGLVDA